VMSSHLPVLVGIAGGWYSSRQSGNDVRSLDVMVSIGRAHLSFPDHAGLFINTLTLVSSLPRFLTLLRPQVQETLPDRPGRLSAARVFRHPPLGEIDAL
jgi:hypothetical protein